MSTAAVICFIDRSLQDNGEESGSSASLNVAFSNLLTTSKTLNTQRNTGTVYLQSPSTDRHIQVKAEHTAMVTVKEEKNFFLVSKIDSQCLGPKTQRLLESGGGEEGQRARVSGSGQ